MFTESEMPPRSILAHQKEGKMTELEPMDEIVDRLTDIRLILLIGETREIYGKAAARELWARTRLPAPPAAHRTTPDSAPDTLSDVACFVRTCTQPSPGNDVGTTEMYAAYVACAREDRGDPLSLRRFTVELKALDFHAIKRSRMYWRNVAILPDHEGKVP
jgi:hypothetical protein